MSQSVIALLLAVVGVLGTLASALLSQRGGRQTKLMELQHAERQHASDKIAEGRRIDFEDRRACYVAVNKVFRRHQAALKNYFSSLSSNTVKEGQWEEIEETRHASRETYAEAQMVLPEEVLNSSAELVKRFNFIYGALARFSANNQRPEDDLDQVREQLDHATAGLYYLRQGMRADLGISDSSESPEATVNRSGFDRDSIV
ncbi:hypothetical protein ABZ892_16720 [Streptomyces sp. NPDC046924]|uniref:hypothetical protein n=1 Tax=Streptomyces sp. NPDC046924 TaxID=3155136 RepID=UPI0033F2DC1F